jgi:hypothetical protein
MSAATYEQIALVRIVKGQAIIFSAGGLAARITAALPHKVSAPRRPTMLRGWTWWKTGVGIAFAALIASNIVLYGDCRARRTNCASSHCQPCACADEQPSRRRGIG